MSGEMDKEIAKKYLIDRVEGSARLEERLAITHTDKANVLRELINVMRKLPLDDCCKLIEPIMKVFKIKMSPLDDRENI